jgi:hypothetical protein
LGVAGIELGVAEMLDWPEQPTANNGQINKIGPNFQRGTAFILA